MMWTAQRRYLIALALCLSALFATGWANDALARRDANGFIAKLSGDDRKVFEAYLAAKTFYDAEVDAFWGKVESKRSKRRKKKKTGGLITAADYVDGFPPEYDGPTLPKALAKAWSAYLSEDEEKRPVKPPTELPGIPDYLREAKAQYGFEPDRIPEREFKRRYAREALRLGLNSEQVVRVYALETSGLGTADMQAGIHPIRRTGKPISSALGYAQLLAANSVNELQKHGATFLTRLQEMARDRGVDAARREALQAKVVALGKMVKRVKRVPNRWSSHQSFAKTGAGMGIHPINIDGDIGPWLQVIKLKGIRDMAVRAGRADIGPTELELMNLAGPGTGLEMLTSVGLTMPTVNFFSRRGYERNTIVRGNTSRGLLEALSKRMDDNVKNSGAREFYEVFAEAQKERRAEN